MGADALGAGATNEIIEFSTVPMVPDTNFGGYFKTALDLCFNAPGAVLAVLLIGVRDRRRGRAGKT